MKKTLELFLTMLKIGAIAFGGGYTVVSLIRSEFVEKKKWLEASDFYDMLAISESTPGPLAVNAATYIGYRLQKTWGAIVATLGVVLPSFITIYLISLFFSAFLSLTFVAYAFRGVQACVTYLILSAGIKMLKELNKTPLNLCVFTTTFAALLVISLFSVRFSSVFFVLIGGLIGGVAYTISKIKRGGKRK